MLNMQKYNSHKKKALHLKKKNEQPCIPTLKKPAIAINIDFKKKKEHLVIGDFDNVNEFIRGRKNVEIIFDKIRPLGSFLLDIITEPEYFSDVKANFCEISKKKYTENLRVAEGLFEAENPILKFVALSLWDEYGRILRASKEKNEEYPVLERLEDLTLPFRYNLMENILNWQKHKPFNPLMDMPTEYFRYPALTMIIPHAKGTIEYVASDFALLPLIVYYLKTIYERKKYFSFCRVCGNLFLAPDNNKTFICSDKCKAVQQKKNKKKYDDAHKSDYAEKLHKSEYQYWFNRLSKAKRKNHHEAVSDIEKSFAEFKRISKIKKKQVNTSLLSQNAYYLWCLEQRGVIDDIMIKHNLFERG